MCRKKQNKTRHQKQLKARKSCKHIWKYWTAWISWSSKAWGAAPPLAVHFVLDCWFLGADLNERCFSLTVSGNWTLHLWKGFSHISTGNLSPGFFVYSQKNLLWKMWWMLLDGSHFCSAIHLQWIRHAEMAKKLNVSRNGSTSFLIAGQSTCTGRFLSLLHARLSLNTWQVKPDGTGSGLGGRVGVYGRRRRGDARSDPKCLDLCVHCMCGCSNQLPHRSFPFIPPLSLFHSVSLSSPRLPLSSLFVPRLGSPHSSFLWEDHVRLFNVSTSFVT